MLFPKKRIVTSKKKEKDTNRRSPWKLEEPTGGFPPYDVWGKNSSPEEVRFESDSSSLPDLRLPPTRVVRKVDMVDASLYLIKLKLCLGLEWMI